MTITDRNAGYAGRKLGEANFKSVALRIVWPNFLRGIFAYRAQFVLLPRARWNDGYEAQAMAKNSA
jgi:hypothetical protein